MRVPTVTTHPGCPHGRPEVQDPHRHRLEIYVCHEPHGAAEIPVLVPSTPQQQGTCAAPGSNRGGVAATDCSCPRLHPPVCRSKYLTCSDDMTAPNPWSP